MSTFTIFILFLLAFAPLQGVISDERVELDTEIEVEYKSDEENSKDIFYQSLSFYACQIQIIRKILEIVSYDTLWFLFGSIFDSHCLYHSNDSPL